MARGIAVHIGVNTPASHRDCPLTLSEGNAWKMAELSQQAGYGEIHLLRGAAATCERVVDLLTAAVKVVEPGEMLLITYSGHGAQVVDTNGEERDKQDETWCLHDADLVDDGLLEIWRQTRSRTRVVLVSESCFGGGIGRHGDDVLTGNLTPPSVAHPFGYPPGAPVMRGPQQYAQPGAVARMRVPDRNDGIEGSVLVLAAASEGQKAREGLYLRHLLDLWNGGACYDTFYTLHQKLCMQVSQENPGQDPHIALLGSPDPEFAQQMAFHVDPPVMRGGLVVGGDPGIPAPGPVMRGGVVTRG